MKDNKFGRIEAFNKDLERDDCDSRTHRQNVAYREFVQAQSEGVFILGQELFDIGITCENFFADAMLCFLFQGEERESVYNSMMDNYVEVSNFPSLELVIKIFKNKNYYKCLCDGYGYQSRKRNFETSKIAR